jgi:predicted DNA-binding transcriptional regulator AlpA
MSKLPETGFLRLAQIIGNPKADPPIPALIPVSKSTWWEGVKSGRFPAPVKLGPRITAWRIEDIRALIEAFFQDAVCA